MSCKQAVKPPVPLRGNCHAALVRYLIQAPIISVIGSLVLYIISARPRKQKYRKFYKTYDSEAAFSRMIKKGDYFTHLEPCP